MLSKYINGKSVTSAFGVSSQATLMKQQSSGCEVDFNDHFDGQTRTKSGYLCFGLILGLTLFSISAYAQTNQAGSGIISNINSLSPQTILANIQKTIPKLTQMVTAIAFVIGIFMIIIGVMQLKHVGEMRTQMSHEHHLTKPLLSITIGTLLIYLPSSVQMGMSTFWTTPNPYGYIVQSDQWQQAINICFAVVQFIGVVSFIRGLIMLSHVGGGHQQGAFSKGLMHVIGGIFCININQFMQVVLATLGVQS